MRASIPEGSRHRNIAITRLIGATVLVATLVAPAVAVLGNAARAAEVRLLSAAAMQSVLKEIASDFERISGHSLIIDYATMGAIDQRVLGGETADLVIGSSPSISKLVKEGRIRADSQVTICKVGVGLVVASGSPKPQIASLEDFKRALLAAKLIVYAEPAGGGAAGIHVARVIEKLGLAEQLSPKTKFGVGGDITEVTLAHGEGALGLTQISEIVEKRGAEFLGSLPEELQSHTGVAAGIPTGAAPSEGAMALIKFLTSPTGIAVIKAKGMEIE